MDRFRMESVAISGGNFSSLETKLLEPWTACVCVAVVGRLSLEKATCWALDFN